MPILLYDLVGADASRPFSPHCWKIAFALAHKGMAFERVPTPFTGVASVEGGVEGGTCGTVPVIRDGDKVVGDSFAIARYLDETYPDRPTLFGGEGGQALSRFIESWTNTRIHTFIRASAMMDIHDRLAPADQAHMRASREKRFGMPLEDMPVGREDRLEAFRAELAPLRDRLAHQPFIGGQAPLFADHIVAGAFQWSRVISPFALLVPDDRVAEWFERCLDLYGGMARKVPAAA